MNHVDLLSRVKIKAMLIGDPDVGAMEIGVDVTDGVVTLTGEVETEEQKEIAEQLASQVTDVVAVRNELEVVGVEEVERRMIEGSR